MLRALQLGDMLCAVPAFRAIRAALPDAHVTLIGLPWAQSFAARFRAFIDDVLPLPGFPGLPEQPAAPERLPAFLAEAQSRRFDVAIQMHGDGSVSNVLVALLGSVQTAGFFLADRFCPDPRRFLRYPATGSERGRLLALTSFLGWPERGEELEFPVGATDVADLKTIDVDRRLRPGAYVCVHPGGRAVERRWDPARFAHVADLLNRRGLGVVLTGGAEERAITGRVAALMAAPAIDLAGRTSLGALAVLLARARLLVSNDTGVAHLAEAVGTPSVVLFHPSQVDRWAPTDRARHRVVSPMETASSDMVVTQATDLMDSMPGAPRAASIEAFASTEA